MGWIDHAPGHPSRELTWDDISAKFMDCAAQARIDPRKAQRAFTILEQLETCADIGEVMVLLHGHPLSIQGEHTGAGVLTMRGAIF